MSRLTYTITDEWPDTPPLPSLSFAPDFPAELMDPAILAELTLPPEPEEAIEVPPTIFRGRETVSVTISLPSGIQVTVARTVIRSTHRRPQ